MKETTKQWIDQIRQDREIGTVLATTFFYVIAGSVVVGSGLGILIAKAFMR